MVNPYILPSMPLQRVDGDNPPSIVVKVQGFLTGLVWPNANTKHLANLQAAYSDMSAYITKTCPKIAKLSSLFNDDYGEAVDALMNSLSDLAFESETLSLASLATACRGMAEWVDAMITDVNILRHKFVEAAIAVDTILAVALAGAVFTFGYSALALTGIAAVASALEIIVGVIVAALAESAMSVSGPALKLKHFPSVDDAEQASVTT